MKTSVYQFKRIASSINPHTGHIHLFVDLYASTRDFYGFEQYHEDQDYCIALVIDFDTHKKIGTIYQYSEDDADYTEAGFWQTGDNFYAGLMFLKKYPLIVEISKENMWIRVFQNKEYRDLSGFITAFKDKYDLDMQYSIIAAKARLNVNIALGDTYHPELPICVY